MNLPKARPRKKTGWAAATSTTSPVYTLAPSIPRTTNVYRIPTAKPARQSRLKARTYRTAAMNTAPQKAPWQIPKARPVQARPRGPCRSRPEQPLSPRPKPPPRGYYRPRLQPVCIPPPTGTPTAAADSRQSRRARAAPAPRRHGAFQVSHPTALCQRASLPKAAVSRAARPRAPFSAPPVSRVPSVSCERSSNRASRFPAHGSCVASQVRVFVSFSVSFNACIHRRATARASAARSTVLRAPPTPMPFTVPANEDSTTSVPGPDSPDRPLCHRRAREPHRFALNRPASPVPPQSAHRLHGDTPASS